MISIFLVMFSSRNFSVAYFSMVRGGNLFEKLTGQSTKISPKTNKYNYLFDKIIYMYYD